MSLNEQVHQGHFGEGFVWALACAAGLNPGKRILDVDGVDIIVGFPGKVGTLKSPSLEAQIKSWSQPKARDGHFAYPLPVSNFNALVGKVGIDLACPRYLFLVVVPADADSYAHATEAGLTLSHAAYWLDLMDEEEIDPEVQESKTVYVPQANLLTSDMLRELIEQGWARRTA
ncbi:DUF4365 domain-containing protein [Microbispora bryophytorum]|uniref:DUF4365 domain-containing protein n=1 Tax=Microbispora bryophytorum TaxID=1460882 RepID=UPI00371E503F